MSDFTTLKALVSRLETLEEINALYQLGMSARVRQLSPDSWLVIIFCPNSAHHDKVERLRALVISTHVPPHEGT